jgi:hypothetical protein
MAGTSRLAVVAAALALASPVLAGCSDDPPTAAPPPTAASSSPTGSSGTPSGPPALPAAAKGTTPAAAKAFVRYYVDLINYGLETLDAKPLRTASSETCDFCAGIAKALDRSRRLDRSYEGGRWHLRKISIVPGSSATKVATQVVVDAQTIKGASGGDTLDIKRRVTALVFVIDRGSRSPRTLEVEVAS